MRDYRVSYVDGKSERIEVVDKTELIERLFDGSEERFKELVSVLEWRSANMFFAEDVATGKIDSQIITADINPYG